MTKVELLYLLKVLERAKDTDQPLRRGFFGRLKWLLLGK